jgi:colanic acid/amylovoran biosynthesis glycosyltransferase
MKPHLVVPQARHARGRATATGLQRTGSVTPGPASKGPVSNLRRAMRIGYVMDRFPRGSHGFVLQEILELESRGIAVEIFSLGRPDGRLDDIASALSRLRGPVHYYLGNTLDVANDTGWTGLDDNLSDTAGAAQWVANLVASRGIEHLHAHGATLPADVTREAGDLAGLGYSFTAHANGLYEEANQLSLREKTEAARFAVAMRTVDHGRLLQICGNAVADKLYRIPMGINPDESRFADAECHDSDSVLAVGPLVENSGFTDLIDAFAMLRDRGRIARLTIVGEGPCEHELRAHIERLRLSTRVHLLGGVSRTELFTLMRVHTALAVPWVADDHERDVLANLVLEAMAVGLPVLATDLPGIRELIDDGMSGRVIRPHDPRWLAGALETLFDSREVREGLAHQARNAVEREFAASRNVSHLARLFFQAVSRNRLTT